MERAEFVSIVKELLKTANNETALRATEMYSLWEDFEDGHAFEVGDKVKVIDDEVMKLAECRQEHNKQSDWRPSQATASIWKFIDKDHAGTLDDPIPFVVNMEVFKDKYYSYNGVTYLCTRDSGVPLQHTPDQLIGHYFEVA